MNTLLMEGAVLTAASLLAYHHVGYPALMALAAGCKRSHLSANTETDAVGPARQPHVTVVMPAFNEAAHIERKIAALAAQTYPKDRFSVVIGSDGSTDGTVERARHCAARYPALDISIVDFPENRGKLAVLNDIMAGAGGDIVVFSDVSAIPRDDAIDRVVRHFSDPKTGAVGGGYILPATSSVGERLYWRIQRAVKVGESTVAGLIGAHGAFYAIRRSLWRPLSEDTINDDFIVPMRIAEAGYRTLYDPFIRVSEAEDATDGADWRRRVRIGAGNVQQALRLHRCLSPAKPGLAFCFLSGKVLRMICPLLIAFMAVASIYLAPVSPVMASLALLLGAAFVAALFGPALGRAGSAARYALRGHAANLVGVFYYATGRMKGWSGRAASEKTGLSGEVRGVERAKRAVDVAGALVGLALTAPLFPVIALAVKLESRGPVFFRQLRVGRALGDRTELFEMIKFRSMRTDAEVGSGPAWAQKNDPRVTRVGLFLRKTRLDELPQFLNVLRGEMSLIGPRPERPGFCRLLDREIPFYIERTFGVRPGITGLAQVRQGYDETLDDVRRKIMYDHSYAASIGRVSTWLRTDTAIVFETLLVMAFGRGR